MKVKPYTGPASAEMVIRTICEALTGGLTLTDNAAVRLVTVQWNSAVGVRIPGLTRPPLSVVLMRAVLLSNPASHVSGGGVAWEPQPNGDLVITGIDSLSGSVDWEAVLMLVES